MASEPTVFIVDDDRAVCDSLRWLVESVGLDVETHSSAREFLDTYDLERPGCLILDVRMPEMSGIEALKAFADRGLPIPVIVITGHGDVPTAVRAMKLGAVDLIEKPFNDQLLLDRIQECIRQDADNRRELAGRAEIVDRFKTLSPREREVMDLVVAGKSNKVIARQLGTSPKTIEAQRANVMRKLGTGSLAELVQMAVIWRS